MMVSPNSLPICRAVAILVGTWSLCESLQACGEASTTGNSTRSGRMSLVSLKNSEGKHKLKCGQRSNSFESRIVGGKPATITEFPWMVSIQREQDFWFGLKVYYHFCGGSILTPSWIVTAAHCMYNNEFNLRLVAGVDNMDFLNQSQTRMIARVVIHPNYNSGSYDNDIALIKVNRPFELSNNPGSIAPICLERDVPIITYDIASVCGFGANAFHMKSQTHLFKTDIAIIETSVCNKSFDNTITNNMICAGGMIEHKRDACTGDSGGPLVLEVDDHITLIGLVSFGNDCASKGFPGVYSKVPNYYDWLLRYIDEPLPEP